MLKFQSARRKDLDAITEIYNETIIKTVSTFDTESKISGSMTMDQKT